jgi:hypothetical protein
MVFFRARRPWQDVAITARRAAGYALGGAAWLHYTHEIARVVSRWADNLLSILLFFFFSLCERKKEERKT